MIAEKNLNATGRVFITMQQQISEDVVNFLFDRCSRHMPNKYRSCDRAGKMQQRVGSASVSVSGFDLASDICI
jgi:hypothetical protein